MKYKTILITNETNGILNCACHNSSFVGGHYLFRFPFFGAAATNFFLSIKCCVVRIFYDCASIFHYKYFSFFFVIFLIFIALFKRETWKIITWVLLVPNFPPHFSIHQIIWFNSIYHNDGRFIQTLNYTESLCSDQWTPNIFIRFSLPEWTNWNDIVVAATSTSKKESENLLNDLNMALKMFSMSMNWRW